MNRVPLALSVAGPLCRWHSLSLALSVAGTLCRWHSLSLARHLSQRERKTGGPFEVRVTLSPWERCPEGTVRASGHSARAGHQVLLLHATHHHTHVGGLDHDGHPFRLEHALGPLCRWPSLLLALSVAGPLCRWRDISPRGRERLEVPSKYESRSPPGRDVPKGQ